MRENFQKALPKFLAHEGGYVNHPNDPGGPTNMGVTLANYRRYVKRNGTITDLKNITKAEVGTVFKRHYWDKVEADDLPSGVDYCVADFAINSGPSRAAKYLQKAVGVAQDGVIGPKTLAAVNKADPRKVINTICDERLAFMKRIKGGSLWKTFGKGWQRRVDAVRLTSRMWVYEAPQEPQDAPQPVPAPEAPPSPPRPSPGKSEAKGCKSGSVLIAAIIIFAGILIYNLLKG